MYDCLIIGGGLAGLTAAIYTARAGLSTAVIEGEQCGGQAVMADLVENYPGFVGSGYELAEKTEQQAENVGVEIIYDEIESVDFEGKVKKAVGFENSYEGKFVIVATGAKHKRAGFQGEENFTGAGVSYCAVCDGAFFADMEVAVIGGANTAVSEAIYLSNICKKVYLIYRKDKLRADNTLVERLNTKENIEVLYNTIPVKVDGNDSVEKLITDKGELSVKGVFVAVGFNPSTTIFENKLELDEYGYIKTDSNLATNVSGVFAVGDCRTKQLRQMITAASDGANAGTVVAKLAERW
ncbi:MAG: FAD-dependent oxidoreductase [Clostridia bacterium]|nr:FAD-dependent oxidoreductase [Clostridia bacterium]